MNILLCNKKSTLLFFLKPFLLLVWICCASFAWAQTGSIKGTVKTADGKPAEFVTVALAGTTQGISAGENGRYILKNVQPGKYTLTASFVGLQTQTQVVTVKIGETLTINFVMTESSQALNEVLVKSPKYNKFLKKETEDVARLPLKNIENPQVYTVVTSDLMKEQVVTSYVDGFKNVPGAGVPLVYNNGRTSLLSRGFVTANFVRNSVAGYNFNSVDPADIEKIEAIKGPSGTLFNSSLASFGGLFNRVTKQPFDSTRTELTYQTGGYDLNRLTVDVNMPLNKEKTLLLRVNTALHNEHSFQDAGFYRGVFVAPSLTYQVNDRLLVQLNTEIGSFDATSAYRLAPDATGTIHNIADLGINYNLSFANNSLHYTSNQIDIYALINYKISDHWKSQTMFNKTFSTTKGFVTALSISGSATPAGPTLKQQAIDEDYPYYITNVQQNFIGDFKIGSFRNRVIAGLEYYDQRSNNTNYTVTMPGLDYKTPGTNYNNFNSDKVSALIAAQTLTAAGNNYIQVHQGSYAAYVSDVFNITDNLNAMASIRVDRYRNWGQYLPAVDATTGNYVQTALSPKFGLVYEVIKNQLSIFGNHMNGFSNVTATTYDGSPLKPQYADQWETGIKVDLWNHKISSTISYYNISVTNTTMDDADHLGFSTQAGTQSSKGIEAELIANPFSGFNIIAGYAYNDSKITQGNTSVLGRRPATAGPDKLVNLWMSYRVPAGSLQGLGLGIGGNYGSSSFQTNTSTFQFIIPAYRTIDATAFYDRPKFRVGFKLDNLTNEKYWSFRLAPQMPARGTFSLALKF